MHYRNGRAAKVGDQVIVPNGTYSTCGFLVQANPDAQSCNGLVAPAGNMVWVTIGELLHFEDAMKAGEPAESKAARLYTQYCAAVGGKAFNGDPLPEWADFRADPAKKLQSDAWLAAAAAV